MGSGADADVQANILTTDKLNIGWTNAGNQKYSGSIMSSKTINSFGVSTTNLVVTYTAPPPPNAPTSASISTQSTADQLTMTWTAPSSGSTPDGYRIDRSVGGGAFTTLVATTGSVATSYTDTTVARDTSYQYRIYSMISFAYP